MKRMHRILIALGFIFLMIISWAIVLGSKSDSDIQTELMAQAAEYIADEVYILAVPLLEEAAGYNTALTLEAENELKEIYLILIDQRGYRGLYAGLLDKQMNRADASVDVFIEAADFYLNDDKFNEAFTVLKNGINKTGSDKLLTMYENNRYVYRLGSNVYEDVTAIHNLTIGVKWDNLWGIANSNGTLQIPCIYEKVSTYSGDRAVVMKDNVVFAINKDNNRVAKLNTDITDFGNLSNDRIPIQAEGKWYRATGNFVIGSMNFEEIGTYFNGYTAAKANGRWGVIDTASSWLIPAEYDGIVMDELGRSYAQGAVFIKRDNGVYLYLNGNQVGNMYDDAKPFSNEGYAAVKKDGLWGFIDSAGNPIIPYKFEDALSFGQHLAAIKQGEFWGYINLYGDIAIEPVFLQAKSFAGGSAPVLTERGWQFISLIEN